MGCIDESVSPNMGSVNRATLAVSLFSFVHFGRYKLKIRRHSGASPKCFFSENSYTHCYNAVVL